MDFVNNLFNGMGYVEGITIINIEGEILFSAKFNNKFDNDNDNENYEIVGENFLDIYENLNEESSSLYTAMRTGVPVYTDSQIIKSRGKNPIKIASLSIPIKSGRRIVGAIDISVSEDDSNMGEKLDEEENMEILDSMLSEFNKIYKLDTGRDSAVYKIEDIHTCDKEMLRLRRSIDKLARTDLPVLIYGETGTGKELVAQAFHNASLRASKPFIAQNCGSIPANLMESILFGTSKGAFTGALDNVGLLELADGGTLLLDEINSLPMDMQAKLLRVIQNGTFRRLGDRNEKKVDVRIIATTNEKPEDLVKEGKIRQDLLYRLAVLTFDIPPLRDRKKDIPMLTNLFVNRYSNMLGKNIHKVSYKVYDEFVKYPWYGNVRELENVIAFGISMADPDEEVLELSHVEPRLIRREPDSAVQEGSGLSAGGSEQMAAGIEGGSYTDLVEEFERKIIAEALESCGGNITKASAKLNIPRQTLSRKIKDLGIK